LSLMVVSSRGWELSVARRYREAEDAFRMADDLDPAFQWSHLFRAWSYEARGKYAAAIDTLNRAGGKNDVVLGELAHALGRAGRKAEAARILEELTASSAGHYVSPYDLSRAYEGLGRRDEAMSALVRACDDRSPIIVFLKVEPVFAEWRSDPRFVEILRRLHLE
ncbi:MAG: hilA 8, partial [Candidatus Solibacter sp.]|nr:hilA 8 [Candidatus Solibacter sp.]